MSRRSELSRRTLAVSKMLILALPKTTQVPTSIFMPCSSVIRQDAGQPLTRLATCDHHGGMVICWLNRNTSVSVSGDCRDEAAHGRCRTLDVEHQDRRTDVHVGQAWELYCGSVPCAAPQTFSGINTNAASSQWPLSSGPVALGPVNASGGHIDNNERSPLIPALPTVNNTISGHGLHSTPSSWPPLSLLCGDKVARGKERKSASHPERSCVRMSGVRPFVICLIRV